MLRLDWTSPRIVQTTQSVHPTLKTQLELQAAASEWSQVLAHLDSVFRQKTESELKHELPGGWTIYWKGRDTDSQLFLAHPEKDTWVITAALNWAHADAFLVALEKLINGGGASVAVSPLGNVNRLSNVEVVVGV